MIERCVFCHGPLPANDQLEHFAVGRRIAYDPERGRLWAVCPGCARWTLAPIEERWEALEELEKLTRDRARLLARTENIQLVQAGPIEIVRVGAGDLREEAWWRYGRELLRRKAQAQRDLLLGVIVGIPGLHLLRRSWTFDQGAWSGRRCCTRCGAPVVEGELSPRTARRRLLLLPGDGGFTLTHSCRRCARAGESGFAAWSADEARAILRTVLAYENFGGAGWEQVSGATARIAAADGPEGLLRAFTRQPWQLSMLHHPEQAQAALALEIALNDELERLLLRRELVELASAWREAEELAAIVDGELTPLPNPPRTGSAQRTLPSDPDT